MKIFVYGTLMKGFAGHIEYLSGKEPEATGYIQARMYYLPVGYPVIILKQGYRVYGEIYDVNEETMEAIRIYEDIFEAEPMYEERILDVRTDNGVISAAVFSASKSCEKQVEAFGTHVPSGRWDEFIL
ncbi:gamma-glutamylcyclotransferase [Geovibrio thiophilus]|uniref:Gamma-glutamylcyclotransferase n=1 Tax=Geovibrio thiophilus TaxID=139438 RepID=A0A3R5UV04_9BACT|nr:gamma-glutamylcyclotransferase family protein [Geovibrio thiophilus]QAR33319.1 gamma-glutamylcyclotransferase [Geovibrio thiophilus]